MFRQCDSFGRFRPGRAFQGWPYCVPLILRALTIPNALFPLQSFFRFAGSTSHDTLFFYVGKGISRFLTPLQGQDEFSKKSPHLHSIPGSIFPKNLATAKPLPFDANIKKKTAKRGGWRKSLIKKIYAREKNKHLKILNHE